jgi:hypothetical protein
VFLAVPDSNHAPSHRLSLDALRKAAIIERILADKELPGEVHGCIPDTVFGSDREVRRSGQAIKFI